MGFTKNNVTFAFYLIHLSKLGIKKLWVLYKRSVQLCQSVAYTLAAWIVHECDEMQTAHRTMITQLSWNQVLEWTSKSVQDPYSFNDFKRNFGKHFYAKIKLT